MAHSIRIIQGQTSFTSSSHASEPDCIPSWHSFPRFVRHVQDEGDRRYPTPNHRSALMLCVSYGLLVIYWLIIASVSVYDMHLTVKYAGTLKSLEQNPVGRWLMQLDAIQHDVIPDTTLFLSFKSLGTIVVMLILAILIRQRARLGHPVAIGVTMFQLSLAWYLKYGDIPDNWFIQ